ncbi:hypothetical protein AGMMS4952_14640 [Spirochaetia bacterium]|nr:hypothetical protein AGMMS4952_14640 [Spirochaetia bacterium]
MINETPRLVAARRGFSVSYKGKTLLSTMDPASLADKTVEALLQSKGHHAAGTLYFCPSPLLGYGLTLLLDRIGGRSTDSEAESADLEAESTDSAVLCVETDTQLMALSVENIDESIRRHPRFRLTGTQESASLSAAHLCALVRETWGSRRFRRVETLRLSGGWQMNPELYDSLADTLRQDIALDWGNAMTLVKLGRRYARNALRNLALLPRASYLGSLHFGAAPVLVLGAGPSLDGLLEMLQAAFGELSDPAARPFRILCVDTALPVLYARNIKPDLAVALECQHWNLRDFIGLGAWEVPVAMDLSALPATGELLGPSNGEACPHLFFTPWTKLSLFDRLRAAGLLPEALPPLGSVGLSAVAIACRLSTGPVSIAGIDFSFTLDQSHARSAPAHQDKLRQQTRFHRLIDPAGVFRRGCFTTLSKTGEPVRSNQTMQRYRDLFQREFADVSPADMHPVDASPSADSRIRDIAGSGLPLGIKTFTPEAAIAGLAAGAADRDGAYAPPSGTCRNGITSEKVSAYIREELASLIRLRRILTGSVTANHAELETLLDICDYLWAHFPDCAGAEGRRPAVSDVGFLKRVRAEIDPFIKVLQGVLAELQDKRIREEFTQRTHRTFGSRNTKGKEKDHKEPVPKCKTNHELHVEPLVRGHE